ncbi:MAG: hypothetical protein JWO10_797, partial [Microbacteriaceae bacterium]|nr:hypothetical protein [Microbacteriaceae bacterium]
RDWTEPHYERMLYDNAMLLRAYTELGQLEPGSSPATADGIAGFLLDVLRVKSGGFASAQDSESVIDGERVEGGYYALDAEGRAAQSRPNLDAKVLTGWNGLAIEALAEAGFVFDRPEWIDAAKAAADFLVERHLGSDGRLLRASIGDRVSSASATLEDYGMLAVGLLRLATASGEARYATVARDLVDACLAAGSDGVASPFAVRGGPDPVLAARGLALEVDPSEGAYPSGLSSMATAAYRLYLLTAHAPYREAAVRAMQVVADLAAARPTAFGASLALMTDLAEPVVQLVVVSGQRSGAAASVARSRLRAGVVCTVVTPAQVAEFIAAGFELFAGREVEAAYLCRDFVCRLPITDAAELALALDDQR